MMDCLNCDFTGQMKSANKVSRFLASQRLGCKDGIATNDPDRVGIPLAMAGIFDGEQCPIVDCIYCRPEGVLESLKDAMKVYGNWEWHLFLFIL